jgi:hypothetical protein
VLIEHVAGARAVSLIDNAFGFGSSESRTINVGLLRRLLAFGALLEALQIDYVPHAGLDQSTILKCAKFSRRRE